MTDTNHESQLPTLSVSPDVIGIRKRYCDDYPWAVIVRDHALLGGREVELKLTDGMALSLKAGLWEVRRG